MKTTFCRFRLRRLSASGIAHHLIPLLVLVLFAIAGIGLEVATHAATPSNSAAITSGWKGLCLDDWRYATFNANKVDSYHCNATGAQTWQYNATTETIKLANYNLCVGVNMTPKAVTADGNHNIQIFGCRSTSAALATSNQQWVPFDSSLVNVHALNSGKVMCMSIPGSRAPANGTSAELAPCTKQFSICVLGGDVHCPAMNNIPEGQVWHLPKGTSGGGTGTTPVSATFSQGEGTTVPNSNGVLWMGVNVPITAAANVVKVEFFLQSPGPKVINGGTVGVLEHTVNASSTNKAIGQFGFNWHIASLPAGTYTWQAEVFDNHRVPSQFIPAKNNAGGTSLDIHITHSSHPQG